MIDKNKITEVYSETFKNNNIANCSWIMNRYCNYSCSYCWPHAHQKQKDFLTENQYLMAINEIINQFHENGYKKINWGFSGGEITFNPHFLTILNEIQSYIDDYTHMYTNLTTNMSQSMKWWSKFVENTKYFKKVKINGSWHSEYLTDEKKKEAFSDKILFLESSGITTDVNYVMIPGKLDYAKHLIDFFKEKNIFILIKSCRLGNNLIDGYTNKELKFLSNSSKNQINRKLETKLGTSRANVVIKTKDEELRFKSFEETFAEYTMSYEGFNCTAGHQAITIYENGNVTRGRRCRNEILGNIKTGFNLHTKIEKCYSKGNCTCSTDLKLPKWK